MKKITIITSFILSALCTQAQNNDAKNAVWILKDGWKMQSSLIVADNGSQISQTGYATTGWYSVTVPTTVIAGLLANNVYDFDPFYGKNLEKIKGPQFDKPWWFRKEFTLPVSEKNKTVILKLQGINYKANVWFNGVLISDEKNTVGPFRIFELDITKQINYDGTNVLALEITRPFNPNKQDGDLAIDYADWIHYPADYNAGIINNAEIKTCDKIMVLHPMVTTNFDLPSLEVAHLTAEAEVTNYADAAEDVTVKGKINDDISFEKQVHLNPSETKTVVFSPADYPQLNIHTPRIWWPWQYGKPELNRIEFKVIRDNSVSSTVSENFGIRQMESKFISDDAREFIVNGKPILLRGAAWAPDIFQRRSPERQEQEIKLVRDMNMNIVRSEGKLEDDNFYEMCDKYGMMVMTGWMCCGAWQYPEKWSAAERDIAMESDRSVMYWLRNKACIFVWLNGSDMPPRIPAVETDYLKIEADLKWQNSILATADASTSKVSGKSGVKMNGPYEWVPPIYWETDPHQYGGAWSFATEISPGPSIPPYESLIKILPADSMAVNNADWLYHCGTMEFGNTKIFNEALSQRYGKSAGIKEYTTKAQAQNYEAHRAMMEAYGLNKYNTATGVVQWMLSNPWPSLIWHTYDYYLYPAGTYFGMKKSMEPLHVQYSYKSKEVIITNSLLKNFTGLTVKADVYNLDGTIKYSHAVLSSVNADSVQRCFTIPGINNLSETYFLRLELSDESGKTESINWYWLSAKEDKLDWDKSKWFYTPQSAYTDFSALQTMPKTTLLVNDIAKEEGTATIHKITVNNTGKAVAFFVHIRVLKNKNGDDILPVIFDDNYFSLAPGESRVIKCSYENKNAGSTAPLISVTAWNLQDDGNAAAGEINFSATK